MRVLIFISLLITIAVGISFGWRPVQGDLVANCTTGSPINLKIQYGRFKSSTATVKFTEEKHVPPVEQSDPFYLTPMQLPDSLNQETSLLNIGKLNQINSLELDCLGPATLKLR